MANRGYVNIVRNHIKLADNYKIIIRHVKLS